MANFSFELQSVALLQSNFERPLDLSFTAGTVTPAISLKVGFGQLTEPASQIEVELTVNVSVPTSDETQPMVASAKMLGLFELVGEAPAEVINTFGNVNGPAILYPFVREVIANLTMKGGVPPVLLPTMNFVEVYALSQQQKQQQVPQLADAGPKKIARPKKPLPKPAKKG